MAIRGIALEDDVEEQHQPGSGQDTQGDIVDGLILGAIGQALVEQHHAGLDEPERGNIQGGPRNDQLWEEENRVSNGRRCGCLGVQIPMLLLTFCMLIFSAVVVLAISDMPVGGEKTGGQTSHGSLVGKRNDEP